MKNNLTFPPSASIGASGEHLVLSNLLKLDYIAGLAPYNTKDYDLIVSSSDGSQQVNIQVKTALHTVKTSNFSKLKWILSEKCEVMKDNLIYSFVYFSQESNFYKIYNLPSKKVSEFITMSNQIYIKLPKPNGDLHKNTSMRVLAADAFLDITAKHNRDSLKDLLLKDELVFLEKYRYGWMDKFEDDWNLFELI